MIYISLVRNVVVLKQGLESFWIPYQKDTGRGVRTVVRKAHSAQTSQKLKEWQYVVAVAANRGDVMKAARKKCIEAAQEAMGNKSGEEKLRAAMRFFRSFDEKTIENSVCKMSVLRLKLREVLQEVHKNKNKYLEQQGQAGELRVFKF